MDLERPRSLGAFGEEHGFRKGLLPIRSFIDASTDLVQPTWEPENPADSVLAATWGLRDPRRQGTADCAVRAGSRRVVRSRGPSARRRTQLILTCVMDHENP
jgi:hypothetical protein